MEFDARTSWNKIRGPLATTARNLGPVLPYALLLSVGLGLVVWFGAELANSYPSDAAPFGWKGPASFDAGVATLRPALVLAATIPALLLGLASSRRLERLHAGHWRAGLLLLSDLALIYVACWGAAAIAHGHVSKTSNESFWAFTGTHALLAAAFYSLAALSAVLVRAAPALLAGITWTWYVAIYDSFLRWKTLRQIGLQGLQAGALPGWFYAAQAASPVSLYRALLIIWHKGFRDYEERAVLENAVLPSWMTPNILAYALALLWIVIPLEAAWVVWTLRRAHDERRHERALTQYAWAPTANAKPAARRASLFPRRRQPGTPAEEASPSGLRRIATLFTGKRATASSPPKDEPSAPGGPT